MKVLILVAALALSACQKGDALDQPKQARVMTPIECKQASDGLLALKEKAALAFVGDGTATIEERLWLEAGEEGRQSIVLALAANASCEAKAPLAEVNVEIRNEGGQALEQQVVDLSFSPSVTASPGDQ